MKIKIRSMRLNPGDRELARTLFATMAEVFQEECGALTDVYIDRLLSREEFWAIAAIAGSANCRRNHGTHLANDKNRVIRSFDLRYRRAQRSPAKGRWKDAGGRTAGPCSLQGNSGNYLFRLSITTTCMRSIFTAPWGVPHLLSRSLPLRIAIEFAAARPQHRQIIRKRPETTSPRSKFSDRLRTTAASRGVSGD